MILVKINNINRSNLFAPTLLFCAVAISYANSFWGAFQFDDFKVIVNNPRVHSWPAWWQNLQQSVSTATGQLWRDITGRME